MNQPLKVCCFVLAVVHIFSVSGNAESWPTIQPVEAKQNYVHPGMNGTDTAFLLLLRSRNGTPLYKLECHNGNYEETSELNFSGDFQCALFALKDGDRASWNLLATNSKAEQGSDWLNRGRMTANQLWGDCGAIPEYGVTREFRLRGMLLRFRFTDLQWSPSSEHRQPQLEGFTFEVSALPDRGAVEATASSPGTSTVPSACK